MNKSKIVQFVIYALDPFLKVVSFGFFQSIEFVKVCKVLVYGNGQMMKSRKLLNVSFKYFIRFLIFQFYGVC